MSYQSRQKQIDRRQALASFRREYALRFNRTITDSEARACFRGECSTEEYRLAYQIMQYHGVDTYTNRR